MTVVTTLCTLVHRVWPKKRFAADPPFATPFESLDSDQSEADLPRTRRHDTDAVPLPDSVPAHTGDLFSGAGRRSRDGVEADLGTARGPSGGSD